MARITEVRDQLDGSGAQALRRSTTERLMGGVAGGLSAYLDVDPLLIRVGFVALAFAGGFALTLYLAAWLLVPEAGSDESTGEHVVRRVTGDGWRQPGMDGE
jgi:phage shock protein PspC (stress-responsive transcriptional regulator)